MPAIDSEQVVPFEEVEPPPEKSLSGPIIGIIYPPPEVRSILNLNISGHLFCVEAAANVYH